MKQLRPVIVRLFEEGKKKSEISRLLNLPESTVRKAIKRFQETGNNDDRARTVRPRTANTPDNRKKSSSGF